MNFSGSGFVFSRGNLLSVMGIAVTLMFDWSFVGWADRSVLAQATEQDAAMDLLATDDDWVHVVSPFLRKYCSECHSTADPQADLDCDALTPDWSQVRQREQWAEIVNVLNSHQMPPRDAVQPDPQEVSEVVDWITAQARRHREQEGGAQRVLRRLNRLEYQNTLRDLLGVNVDVSGFPQDAATAGFDNNGQSLTLSPLLLELYFQTAQKAIDSVFVSGEQPPMIRWRFQPESGNHDGNRVEYAGQRVIVNGGQNPVNGDFVIVHHDRWDKSINCRDFQLPFAGRYAVRVRVSGVVPSRDEVVRTAEVYLRERMERDLRENPNGERWHRRAYEEGLAHFRTDSIYDYGSPRLKLVQSLGGQPRVIGRQDASASVESPEILEWHVDFTTQKAGIELLYDYSLPRVLENFWMQTGDEFARPELWVDWIEIEGPIYESWPPPSQRRLLKSERQTWVFENAEQAREAAKEVLQPFMQRAFRRPVLDGELGEKLDMFDAVYREKSSFLEALRYPLVSVLVSPHFLYLPEPVVAETTGPTAQQPSTRSSDSRGSKTMSASDTSATTQDRTAQRLDHFAVASRLSYFLWNSMPDEELWGLADRGELHKPDILADEVRRLLKDPRSSAFVESFVEQWLGLRSVGANPPAADLFPKYDRHLEESMVEESIAFFDHLLRTKQDYRDLIDSDYLVINERMGRFYQFPGVKGDHFRVVSLPEDSPRGGVLTQASVLCLTSNGTRTSPVVRGTWILRNLLGVDPGLPVANAGEIAPSVPGIDKATVRQRLEIHRSLPQCARCHDQIDPLGFSLENFDAAGAYRTQEGFGYKGRVQQDDPVIDASAQMIDGREFSGADGLKQILMQDEQRFARCLCEKLITYAIGRELGVADRPAVDAATAHLMETQQLEALVIWLVQSDLFLSP
jgi:hypothetical protein